MAMIKYLFEKNARKRSLQKNKNSLVGSGLGLLLRLLTFKTLPGRVIAQPTAFLAYLNGLSLYEFNNWTGENILPGLAFLPPLALSKIPKVNRDVLVGKSACSRQKKYVTGVIGKSVLNISLRLGADAEMATCTATNGPAATGQNISFGKKQNKDLAVRVKSNPFWNELRLFIRSPLTDMKRTVIRILESRSRTVDPEFNARFEEDIAILTDNEWPNGVYVNRMHSGDYYLPGSARATVATSRRQAALRSVKPLDNI